MTKLKKKILILIVEDEKILADVLKERLLSEGYDVFCAYDGFEGFKLAMAEHPDLILIDLLMPKIDGLKLLEKLREDPWGKHVKVIILTNVSDPAKVAEGIDLSLSETYEYLVKTDWSLEKIVSKVKRSLGVKN